MADEAFLLSIIAAAIRSLPAEGTGWISVEERLPPIEDHMGVKETDVVLTVAGKSTPRVAWMSAEGKWNSYWGAAVMPTPTHWRELPSPPAKPAPATLPKLTGEYMLGYFAGKQSVAEPSEMTNYYPHTADYRRCACCGCDFAPITSDAEDRYKYCSPDCETSGQRAKGLSRRGLK